MLLYIRLLSRFQNAHSGAAAGFGPKLRGSLLGQLIFSATRANQIKDDQRSTHENAVARVC